MRGVGWQRAVVSALLPILAAIATPAQAGQVSGVDIGDDGRTAIENIDIVPGAKTFGEQHFKGWPAVVMRLAERRLRVGRQ